MIVDTKAFFFQNSIELEHISFPICCLKYHLTQFAVVFLFAIPHNFHVCYLYNVADNHARWIVLIQLFESKPVLMIRRVLWLHIVNKNEIERKMAFIQWPATQTFC